MLTANAAAPRGRSYALVVVEEAAFLPQGDGTEAPDVELLRAVRPALARVPGSLSAVISSPYARRGILHDAVVEGDGPHRVVVSASTLTLNPAFDRREVERAWNTDPTAAASEYGSPDDGTIAFRTDVSGLLTLEALAAVVPEGVRELEPGRPAAAHFDGATGSGADSAALAIAFKGQPTELACLRRWPPPFSPSAVIAEAASVLRAYGVGEVSVDRFVPNLIGELFAEHRIATVIAEHDTSSGYLELLGAINSRRVRLLDVPVLINELSRLERRPGGPRHHVGHAPRQHDDAAAAASGALLAAARPASAIRGLVW